MVGSGLTSDESLGLVHPEGPPGVLLVGLSAEERQAIEAALPAAELLDAAADHALASMQERNPALALVGLGGQGRRGIDRAGLEILSTLVRERQTTQVAALCPAHAQEHAARAVAAGACDVLQPPIAVETLHSLLAQAVRLARLALPPHGRRAARPAQEPIPGVIGESPAMAALRQQVLRVAPTDASVVLTGESGTGKEVIARALHAASRRGGRAFVAINCAAIPETLLESELFGYERGAFTGALRQTPGRIELAHRGTLFLDEIGDLPMALQAKLLRFLQERVIERLGGRTEIPLDVRIICATHRGLAELSAAGRFREDLYYRLAEIALDLPPLRERDGDAILLAQHYLRQYAATAPMPVLGFTGSALEAIDRHGWPGNVRELQNRVKRAVILAEHPRITPVDLDLPAESAERDDLDLRRARGRVERSIIDRALARCEGNLTATARLIGVSRPTLYDLLRHHGLRS